jgi:hypothetical protein
MPIFEDLTGHFLDHELHSADSTVLFTSTRRARAINDGMEAFASETECYIRVSTVTVSCSTPTYNLLSSAVMSTDFVRIAARGVEYHLRSSNDQLQQLSGDDFPRRDIEWLNTYEPGWRASTTPSMPSGYYVDESDGRYLVGLTVPPDVGSSETATLVIPYVARPAPMTSTSDIPYTSGSNVRRDLWPFHMAIVHWAAHQLEKLRADREASAEQLAKYQGFVDAFKGKARAKGANFVRLAKNWLSDAQRSGRRGGASADADPRRWP